MQLVNSENWTLNTPRLITIKILSMCCLSL